MIGTKDEMRHFVEEKVIYKLKQLSISDKETARKWGSIKNVAF